MRWNFQMCVPKFSNKLPTLYQIDSNLLSHSSEYRNLGIHMSSDLSWNNTICSKAYKSLRTFGRFGTIEAIRSLYLVLVRFQLSCCSQLWNPYLIKDMEIVQRRTTKYILNHYTSDYKTQLLTIMIYSSL